MQEIEINAKPYKIALAPMEGVTDFPARLWISLFGGVKAMTTPFYRVTRNHTAKIPQSWAPELFHPEVGSRLPYQLAPQFMAASASDFGRVATDLGQLGSDLFEINCGCPAAKTVGRGAGSSLLQEVKGFRYFIEALSQQVGDGQLSVKMRLGYNDDVYSRT